MARSIHSLAVATSCWNVRWILWRRYRLCDDGNDGRPWYDRYPQHERVTDSAGGHHQSGGSRHLYCGWSRFVAAVPGDDCGIDCRRLERRTLRPKSRSQKTAVPCHRSRSGHDDLLLCSRCASPLSEALNRLLPQLNKISLVLLV